MTDTAPTSATVKTKVEVRNYLDSAQVKTDIQYSLANLSGAMQDHASLMLHYGELLARASKQVDDLKTGLEVAEARVYRTLRDKYTNDKVKITESLLDKEVAAHTLVYAFKKAINEAKQIEAMCKAAVEAFRHRKDMLVQHGAKDRVELEGELRTKLSMEAVNAGSIRALDQLRQIRKGGA